MRSGPQRVLDGCPFGSCGAWRAGWWVPRTGAGAPRCEGLGSGSAAHSGYRPLPRVHGPRGSGRPLVRTSLAGRTDLVTGRVWVPLALGLRARGAGPVWVAVGVASAPTAR